MVVYQRDAASYLQLAYGCTVETCICIYTVLISVNGTWGHFSLVSLSVSIIFFLSLLLSRGRQKNSFRWLCLEILPTLVYFYFNFSYLNCLYILVVSVAGYCLKLEICMTSNSYFTELLKWMENALDVPIALSIKTSEARCVWLMWSALVELVGIQSGELPGPLNCA